MTGRHVVPLLSAYADGELSDATAHDIEAHLGACESCRQIWEQIRAGKALADVLSRVDPPPGLWDEVHADVQRTRERERARSKGSREPGHRRLRFPPRTAGAVAAASLSALALALILAGNSSRTSASEVLSTADEALLRAVQPGELLHRRWRTTQIVTKPGASPVRRDWTSDSWLGGPNLNRAVSRVTSTDGRLMAVSYSAPEPGGGWRGHAYYTADAPGDLRNVHLVMPTKAERRAAIEKLPPADRALIARYYDTPVRPDGESLLLWENRMNRLLLEDPARDQSAGLNIVLSLEPAVMPTGEAAHCVKQLVLGAPWLEWRPDRQPWFQLARITTNQYISKNSFLSLKMESDVDLEDGSRTVATTELVSMQAVRPDAVPDPFIVSVPEGAPVIRLSLPAYLADLARALRRSAAEVGTRTRAR